MIPAFLRVVAAWALCLVAGVPLARAADDPAAWLERMAVALERNDYEGTLVYVHDGEVEAMRVVRTHSEAGPREVLTALTGERREIVREGASARFTLAGGRLDAINGKTVAAVVYRRRLHTVNLFVWPAQASAARTSVEDGFALAEWSDGGLRFAAVSDIPLQELKQFETEYRARSNLDPLPDR